MVCAAAAVAEVRPNVRLLAEPVAPNTLTPVLNVLIPKKACDEVLINPRAVAEASGKFQVAVLPDVDILKSVPAVPVTKVRAGPSMGAPPAVILPIAVSKKTTQVLFDLSNNLPEGV